MAEIKDTTIGSGCGDGSGGGRWGVERYAYILHRLTGLGILLYFLMHIVVTSLRANGIYCGSRALLLTSRFSSSASFWSSRPLPTTHSTASGWCWWNSDSRSGKPIEPVYPYKTSLNVQRPLLIRHDGAGSQSCSWRAAMNFWDWESRRERCAKQSIGPGTWLAGVVILFLLGLHMLIMHLGGLTHLFAPHGEPGSHRKENSLSRDGKLFFTVTYILLLGVALYHGLYGLRTILFELTLKPASGEGRQLASCWFWGWDCSDWVPGRPSWRMSSPSRQGGNHGGKQQNCARNQLSRHPIQSGE